MIQNIIESFCVIIIPGNHDYIVTDENNKIYGELIISSVINKNKILFLKESCFMEMKDIVLIHLTTVGYNCMGGRNNE